jgi:hypothetical protein
MTQKNQKIDQELKSIVCCFSQIHLSKNKSNNNNLHLVASTYLTDNTKNLNYKEVGELLFSLGITNLNLIIVSEDPYYRDKFEIEGEDNN